MSQRGMSLIEVMVSSSIILVTIIGANTQYFQQMTSQGQLKLSLQGRTILNQTVAQVRASASDYPAFFSAGVGNTAVSYIRCFNDKGSPVPSNPCADGSCPSINPIGMFLQETTDDAIREKLRKDICKNAPIAVHVSRPSKGAPKPEENPENAASVNIAVVKVYLLPVGASVLPASGRIISAKVAFDSTL